MNRLHRILLALPLAAAACGGSGTSANPPPGSPDMAMASTGSDDDMATGTVPGIGGNGHGGTGGMGGSPGTGGSGGGGSGGGGGAGGGGSGGGGGAGGGGGGGGVTPAAPRFSTDVKPILQNRGCLSHHMTTAWNDVETKTSDADLVADLLAQTAVQCATRLVVPSDPTTSYLYQKVSGNFAAPCKSSDTMPLGAGPLPAAESDVIKAWIAAGANAD
jgi:hypothetical protein